MRAIERVAQGAADWISERAIILRPPRESPRIGATSQIAGSFDQAWKNSAQRM